MEKFKGFYTKEKLIRIKNCDSIRLFRFSFRQRIRSFNGYVHSSLGKNSSRSCREVTSEECNDTEFLKEISLETQLKNE